MGGGGFPLPLEGAGDLDRTACLQRGGEGTSAEPRCACICDIKHRASDLRLQDRFGHVIARWPNACDICTINLDFAVSARLP